jgi:acylphosphatase
MAQPSHRAEVTFRGTVQGVGFRYTACRLASRHPEVTGAVRNQTDGSVALTAEGTREQVEAFISELITRMSDYIVSNDIQWSLGRAQHHTFGIEC